MKNMASGKIKIVNLRQLSYTMTPSSKITLRATPYVHRYGQVVEIDCYFNVTSTVSNNENILTINKNLPKPTAQYVVATIRNLANGFAMVQLPYADLKHIQAWGSIPTGDYYYLNMVYLTQD